MSRYKLAVPVAIAAVILSAATFSSAAPITVTTTVNGGSRTFTVSSLSGGALDSITLGTAGAAGFVANVTDVRYSRTGYQVTASLSDLYKYASSSYDCGQKISSSAFSLDFLTSPTALSGVEAVVNPVWDLAGTLTGSLATTLGVVTGTPLSVLGVGGEEAEAAIAGVFTGAEDTLPVKVDSGSGGAFASPAPHTTCDASATGATQREVMSGTPSDLSAMFTATASAVTGAADANTNGSVTGSELISTGSVVDATLASAVRTALDTAGVSLALLDTLISLGTITMSQIYAILTGTLRPVTSLVGQTGTYLALPELVAAVPGSTASGTYRGTMTLTLVDVP